MIIAVETAAQTAISRYRQKLIPLRRFAVELEIAVRLAEEQNDPRAERLRREWGQIEIMNAIDLDSTNDTFDDWEVEEQIVVVENLLGISSSQ